ncbi:helix-turn-helix domain-containing protein [Alienimonas sp. DA493]|uniref:helix-turn-helix domain-containing protein n=1 Tax=Alienimonas sp. DA493 TaxID=3373605 RepID=UPI003754CE7D
MSRQGRPPKEPDTTTYRGRLGARLRSLREGQGWSVEELRDRLEAAGLDVTVRTLNGWESGSSSPTVEKYPTIAATFGVTVHGLLPAE